MGKKQKLAMMKVKNAKKPRDNNKPKRPLSGFFRFVSNYRKNHSDMKVTEVTKSAGADWKFLSKTEKNKFMDAAAREQAKYQEDLKKYQKSDEYKEYQEKVKAFKKKKEMKMKKLNKLKKKSKWVTMLTTCNVTTIVSVPDTILINLKKFSKWLVSL